MAQQDYAVLSEVHLETTARTNASGRLVSRFTATFPASSSACAVQPLEPPAFGPQDPIAQSTLDAHAPGAGGRPGKRCAPPLDATPSDTGRSAEATPLSPPPLSLEHCPTHQHLGSAAAAVGGGRRGGATEGTDAGPAEDTDGDPVLQRPKRRRVTLRLPHAMATTIPDVGLQVWSGALLLADFLAHCASESATHRLPRGPSGRLVGLELGAGTGLVSLAAVTLGGFDRCYCTDVGDAVLRNCSDGIGLNEVSPEAVPVRELDWISPPPRLARPRAVATEPAQHESNDAGEGGRREESPRPSQWGWTDDDERCFREETTVLLAADTVYLDSATTAFVSCAHTLLTAAGPPRVLYLAMEKRINFSMDELAVVAPAHDHFLATLEQHQGLEAVPIAVDFPQLFASYTRSPQLELWRITAVGSD